MPNFRSFALFLCCTPLATHAQLPPSIQGCGPIIFTAPSRQQPIVSTARPILRWQSIDGVKRYRVRLRSQIPNGEIVRDIDALTNENEFTAATALAEQFAHIRVQIIPDCDQQFAAASPPDFRGGETFLFDPTTTCETPRWVLRAGATATVDGSTVPVLRWQQNASARLYELTLFSGDNAQVLSQQTLRTMSYPLPERLSQRPLVASLRAQCESGWSDVKQLVVQPATSR